MSSISSLTGTSTSSSVSTIHILARRVDEMGFNVDTSIPFGRRPLIRGAKADRFHPIATNGLYAKLIRDFDNMEGVVQDLVRTLKNDNTQVRQLLQVIPDLLLIDYQLVHYSSQEYDFEIGRNFEMQARREEHLKECDIIYTHNSMYTKDLCTMLDIFLWQLCCELTKTIDILPTFHNVMRYFTSFLRHLAVSEVDPLRLTAFMFALTINQHLNLRKVKLAMIASEIDMDRGSLLYDAIVEMQANCNLDAIHQGRQFNHHFLPYYMAFAEGCEICFTADTDEPFFTNEKNLKFLADLLELKGNTLVKTVLDSCTLLVRKAHVRDIYKQESFKSIVKQIHRRLDYENDHIAMKAAGFFSTSLKYGVPLPNLDEIMLLLVKRSYSINLQLAKSYAQALAIYLKTKGFSDLYKELIKIVEKFDQDTYKRVSYVKYSYLIEALYDNLDEIEPLHVLRYIDKSAELLTQEDFKGLMEILYHSCCMCYNGRTMAQRTRKATDIVPAISTTQYNVTNYLLYITSTQIRRAELNYEVTTWLFKSLAVVNYSADIYQLKDKVTSIVDKAFGLLAKFERIHPNLACAITAFIDKASVINGGYTYLLQMERYLLDFITAFTDAVSDINNQKYVDDNAVQLKVRAVKWATKIKAILCCNVSVSEVDLNSFYCSWESSELPVEIIEAQITCCSLYYKRRIDNLLSSEDFHTLNKRFFKHLKHESQSVWVAMDKYLAKNKDFIPEINVIVEAMWTFLSGYQSLFTRNSVSRCPKVYIASFDHSDMWSNAEHVFELINDQCFSDQSLPINDRRKFLRGAFVLYGSCKSSNTQYILQIIVYYEKFSTLYQNEYKEFFLEVLEANSDYLFKLLMSAICYAEDHKEGETRHVDVDKLCGLLCVYLVPDNTEKFVKYFLDFVADAKKYEIMKYVSCFTMDVSSVALRKLNNYAREIISQEYLTEF